MTVVLFIYIECWIGRVFFLPYFKYIMPQPSVFHVSDEKWDVNLIKDLCAWCFVSCFFLAIFKTLSLSFDSLIIMCLGVYPVCVCVCVFIPQSCPTLWKTMDRSLQGSSAHGILQTRILEWVAMPSSRGSSQPRDWTQISYIADRFFTIWPSRKPCVYPIWV